MRETVRVRERVREKSYQPLAVRMERLADQPGLLQKEAPVCVSTGLVLTHT